MGYSGSGKSTLARKLHLKDNRPLLHLDSVHYTADWKEREKEEEKEIVRTFLEENAEWIIDGNYSSLYKQERLEQADEIILLLFNRFACLWRVIRRYRQFRNRTRPDLADGCIEKLDWEFILWILRDGRTKKKKDGYKRIQNTYASKVTVLKNSRQLKAFYDKRGI